MPLGELTHVLPLGSTTNARGHLTIGGCDVLDVVAEHGTPAYLVAEADLRARAREAREALADAHGDGEVIFASKAFPCTAVLRVFAEEGLGCDVASGGELALARRAGFAPSRLYLHGNARSATEFDEATQAGVGHVILDNLQDISRLAASHTRQTGAAAPVPVLLRVTPDVSGDTHAKISTGQADSKFGFAAGEVEAAVAAVGAAPELELRGLHCHIGSQLLDLAPFRRAVEAVAALGRYPVLDLGGGVGVAYLRAQRPPSLGDWVRAVVEAVHASVGRDVRLVLEPGRALVANAGVTAYTVQSVKRNVSRWVAVDGGMSDNLRPMLYGAPYEVLLARDPAAPASTRAHLAGKHCESGDVLVWNAEVPELRPDDVVITPATGAYGYAMANNYNGVPRPPVIFLDRGAARVVVRRETYDDLMARDV